MPASRPPPKQVRQLKVAGCQKIFREKITGTAADRPQLAKLMKRLVPGDVVIIPAILEQIVRRGQDCCSVGLSSVSCAGEQTRVG